MKPRPMRVAEFLCVTMVKMKGTHPSNVKQQPRPVRMAGPFMAEGQQLVPSLGRDFPPPETVPVPLSPAGTDS